MKTYSFNSSARQEQGRSPAGWLRNASLLFLAMLPVSAGAALKINEVDPDTPGNDVAEFVEIYDGGAGNTSLNGYVLVFFNGSNDQSYYTLSLDGYTTNAEGFFVIGNSAVPGVSVVFASNFLQNGADAVAIYQATAASFPNNTPVTTTNLVDAIVYGTNDADDTGLLTGLGKTVQYNDDADNSISRAPDGSGIIVSQAPTPGATNGGTTETVPPVLAEAFPLIPAAGETGVALDPELSMAFNEAIMAGAGSISLYREAGAVDVLVEEIPVSSLVASGTLISFSLSADLLPETTYYVIVPQGAITDLMGNPFAGLTGETNWRFTSTVPDTTPPSATVFPADDSVRALPTASIELAYDEAVVLGTGTITLTKSDSTVQTFDVTGPNVTLSGSTLSIRPQAPLDLSTGYSVQVPAGVVTDPNGNPSAAITGTTAWNFTTRGTPSVVISQYYEGDGTGENRFIELRNVSGVPVNLDGFRAVAFSSSESHGNQGWKRGSVQPERITALDGITLPAGGYFLIAANLAQSPTYAVNNNDLVVGFPAVTSISGTASVVLYSSDTYGRENIEDAVSIVTTEGTDISFYRLTNGYGFDLTPGTSVTNYASVWGSATPAQVAGASYGSDIYLTSSSIPETLTLVLSPTTIVENDGAEAVVATVTRSGPVTDYVIVDIASSDSTEAAPTFMSVEIPEGASSATFTIDAIDDGFIDGNQEVTISVTASGFSGGSAGLTVQDDGLDLPVDIVINEVDSDTPETDIAEFVELYNKSSTPRSLEGLTLVFVNGGPNGDPVYYTVALTGTIPGNGYFVVGNQAISSASIIIPDNTIQNGADAVALCIGAPNDFTGKGAATITASLVDAVVYGTSDSDDAALLAALTPGSVQVDEGTSGENAIARLPDGGAAFDGSLFVAQAPTPGISNLAVPSSGFGDWIETNAPGQTLGDDHDGDGVPNGVEYFFGLTGSAFTANPQLVNGKITWPTANVEDLTFKVQTSTTLATGGWTDVDNPFLIDTSVPGFISYTPPAPTPGEPKLFIRFVVETLPN